MWYVYVDRTNDDQAFYVGKGNRYRIECLKRNKKHQNVQNVHGIQRSIAFETEDERLALDEEMRLIRELHTYVYDPEASQLACNFTVGGDGVSGMKHSEETKERLRLASIGNTGSLGYRFTPEQSQRLSETMKGKSGPKKPMSPETKLKISASLKARHSGGWHHDEATRQRMSEARRGKKLTSETREKLRRRALERSSAP